MIIEKDIKVIIRVQAVRGPGDDWPVYTWKGGLGSRLMRVRPTCVAAHLTLDRSGWWTFDKVVISGNNVLADGREGAAGSKSMSESEACQTAWVVKVIDSMRAELPVMEIR